MLLPLCIVRLPLHPPQPLVSGRAYVDSYRMPTLQ